MAGFQPLQTALLFHCSFAGLSAALQRIMYVRAVNKLKGQRKENKQNMLDKKN